MTEVATVGGKGRLEDEPNPLGQIRDPLECLHPVGDTLSAGGPQPDIDQSGLVKEIF